MRRSWRRGLALTAAIGLFLAGCGDGRAPDESSSDEQAASDAPGDDGSEESPVDPDAADATADGAAEGQDPNDDVEDGVYRGNGVSLPVPDGWLINPVAFQQGVVVATPEDGAEQLTARAIDTTRAEAADAEPLDIEALLDGFRQQIDQDAAVDEQIDLTGAQQAHRLTYLELPAQQEGQPETSATIVVADSGDGLVGEFAYSAAAEDYDEDIATLLVEQAGFDPDSEPPELPQPPQPAPEGPAPEGDDGDTEEPSDTTG